MANPFVQSGSSSHAQNIRKVRVEDVILTDTPHVAVLINVTAMDDGSTRVLEWPSDLFGLDPSDVENNMREMNKIKEAMSLHKGSVIQLGCL